MSDINRVRWGIISTAHIGDKALVPAIANSNNGIVQAVASRSQAAATEFAHKHDIPAAYGSYDELLADPQIDAVYNPLPNHLHREWSVKALEAGKHVLCEKPLALNAPEAQEMFSAAQKAGRVLMEAFMYRFHPRNRRIKALVEQGAIGDIRLMRAAFSYTHGNPETDIRFKPEMGGGSLMDVGSYGVSVSRWMFGREPEEVQAYAEYGPSGVDVNLMGLLRFSDGGLAAVESSFTSTLQQMYNITGSKGAIEIVKHNAFVPHEFDASFIVRGVDDEVGEEETIPGVNEYRLMVEHFSDMTLGNSEPLFPAEDSINNMRVLDALATAAREGRPVKVAS